MINVMVTGLLCTSMLLVASSCHLCSFIVKFYWKLYKERNHWKDDILCCQMICVKLIQISLFSKGSRITLGSIFPGKLFIMRIIIIEDGCLRCIVSSNRITYLIRLASLKESETCLSPLNIFGLQTTLYTG